MFISRTMSVLHFPFFQLCTPQYKFAQNITPYYFSFTFTLNVLRNYPCSSIAPMDSQFRNHLPVQLINLCIGWAGQRKEEAAATQEGDQGDPCLRLGQAEGDREGGEGNAQPEDARQETGCCWDEGPAASSDSRKLASQAPGSSSGCGCQEKRAWIF